jgi:hypothetical protein
VMSCYTNDVTADFPAIYVRKVKEVIVLTINSIISDLS